MNIIKLNNSEFEVESYNKSTYFTGENISSTASLVIYAADITALNAEFQQPITSIEIYHDGNKIYDLEEISGHVDNMTEYLNGDRMNVSLTISFGNNDQSNV